MATLKDYLEMADAAAAQYNIDHALVKAVCRHESSWNPMATRYEPAFFAHYIEPMHLLDTDEAQLRATSIGLMQIMGQTAREQGYVKRLFDLETSAVDQLDMGCKKLAHCLERKNGDVNTALLMYNGGAAPEYPGLVMQFYAEYT